MSEENHTKFSPFVAGAFTLNYIIGSGFLLLPWAFSKAGLVLSVFVLALVGAFSVLAVYFIINAMYRAVILSDDFQNDEIFHYSNKTNKKMINKIKQSRERYETEDPSYNNLPTVMIMPEQQKQLYTSRIRKLNDYKSLHTANKASADSTMLLKDNNVATSSTSNNSNNNNNNTKENDLNVSNFRRELLLKSSSSSSSYVLMNDNDGNSSRNNMDTNIRLNIDDSNEGVDDEDGEGIRFHLYELTDLCLIFLGKKGKICYGIMLCLYMYGALWAYSSVFAHALSSVHLFHIYHMNDSNNNNDNNDDDFQIIEEENGINYLIYLALFSFFVVPLSCMDLSEQAVVQVVMAGCRFVMLFLMLATIGYSTLFDVQSFSDFLPNESAIGPGGSMFTNSTTNTTGTGSGSDAEAAAVGTITWFDFSSLYLLLPVAAYANIFHHSVPALADNIENKKYIIPVFAGALLICFIFYSLIGAVVSTYFQDHVRPASNLNWVTYIGYVSSSNHFRVPIWAKAISMFIVLFPALDVTSAFPLNAITLGNNMLTFLFDESKSNDDDDDENIIDADVNGGVDGNDNSSGIKHTLNQYNNNNNNNNNNDNDNNNNNNNNNRNRLSNNHNNQTSREIINSRATMNSSINNTVNKSRDDTNTLKASSNHINKPQRNNSHRLDTTTDTTDLELIHKDGYHYYHHINDIDDNAVESNNGHHLHGNNGNHGSERGGGHHHHEHLRSSSNSSHHRMMSSSNASINGNNHNNGNVENTSSNNNSDDNINITSTHSTHHHSRKWWIRKLFRLLAAVPPIIGAAYIRDLGKITDYTGITGFSIAFVFPGLLAIFSQKMCLEKHLSLSTPYIKHLASFFITRATTGSMAQYGCVALGIFLSIFVLINLLLH